MPVKIPPFGWITLALAAAITALEWCGYFARPPAGDVSLFADGKIARVAARVVSPPAFRANRAGLELEALEVSGVKARGRLLLFCYGGAGAGLEPGNTIIFSAGLKLPPRSYKGFDYALYLRRRGIYAVAHAARLEVAGFEPPSPLSRAASAISDDVYDKIRRGVPEREADVLCKMVIGDRSGISAEDRRRFTDAGVMHVLVVSGLNVAYVVLLFGSAFRLAGLRPRAAALLAVPFIFLYALAAGANPPVMRAALTAVAVIISLALAREPDAWQSLSLAAFCILAARPQSLFTPSFQLSFAATAGILFIYPRLYALCAGLPALPRRFCAASAVSVSAQLAVAPLLALYFGKLPVSGLASNIVIVPLAGLITVTGLASYLAALPGPWLAGPAALVNTWLVRAVLLAVDFFSGLKYASVPVAPPPLPLVIAYYIGLALFFGIIKRSNEHKT